jgi:ATP-binding cassette, subfamily C, bacterial
VSARAVAPREKSGQAGRAPLLALVVRFLPRGPATALILLGLGAAALEAIGLALLVPLLALVGVDVGGAETAGVAALVGRMLAVVGLPATLPVVLTVYVALVGLQTLVVRAESVVAVRVRETIAFSLRGALYGAMARMRWPAFTAKHTSHYVHALTTQLDRVYAGTSQTLVLVSHVLIALVYLAVAVAISPVLSLLVLLSGALLSYLSRRFARGVYSSGADLTDATGRLHSVVVEHLANMKVARSFDAAERHIAHFQRVSREVADSWSASGIAFAGSRALFAFGSAVILAVLVYLGVAVLGIGAAGILLLLYVFGRLVPRLGSIQQLAHQILHALPAFRATARELARCECDAETGEDGESPAFEFSRAVGLDDVRFSYDGSTPVLNGISLEIPAGRITAIVGPSGVGKTTVADILLGLRAPDSGAVTVDGVALDDGVLGRWRRLVAYVPQETVLFNESVRSNLQWAVADADDLAMRSALEAAGAGFVFALPDGLDTPVGERGSRLSGGERQRVAIARALLRRPRLLVLDEPTSNLDPDTEAEVLRSLRDLPNDVAIVVISHREAVLAMADTVWRLGNGRVIGDRLTGLLS